MKNVYLVVYGYYGNNNMKLVFVIAENDKAAREQVVRENGLSELDTCKVCSLSDISIDLT